MTSKPWMDFVHPDDRESTIKITENFPKGLSVIQFENRYLCKDGSARWLTWNSYPYPDEGIIIGVAQDVTEKKKAEEALRQSEERYHLIDESSHEMIYSYDLLGRFTHANSSTCRQMNLSLDQIIGKTHAELGFPAAVCDEWDKFHQEVYRTDQTLITETSYSPLTEGEVEYFEVVLNPIHSETGEIIGISGTTRNINARKEAERKIQEQLDELRRWHENTLGREMRVIELKDEVNQALKQAGQPPRYSSNSQMERRHE